MEPGPRAKKNTNKRVEATRKMPTPEELGSKLRAMVRRMLRKSNNRNIRDLRIHINYFSIYRFSQGEGN